MTTTHHPSPHPFPHTVHTLAQRLSATRRGARLARLLTSAQLHAWAAPPALAERAEYVVAELASNAVLHGRVPGRDFHLALAFAEHLTDGPDATTVTSLRIEVTDPRGDRLPDPDPGSDPDRSPAEESGRGLLLVTHLADQWGTRPYPPGGKTVWAELTLTTTTERTGRGA